MAPTAKSFKAYGRAYAGYVMVKWLTISISFFLLSRFEGFTLLWMLWWPMFGAPVLISINVFLLRRKRLL
ncbi:hypothetical protein [Reinekea marinisedimentorum]|uniref:Uncharacterized protein n=1 Tax=Reinekea marinisedimentorum TaxID=230495 RepID=A0A4R3I1E7_9GAMM|nr:hypothetical protein [Reinekea marinisedimentorum]TCS37679.1 hypothetical protein BCF53_11838 [Reinekea marinisedimentorum]